MPPVFLTPNIERYENRQRQATFTAAEVDTRMDERTANYVVDDPIKQGAVTPTRPARWPVIYFLAKSWIRSVDRWHPKFVWDPPGQWIQQNYGVQQPYTERANIRTPSNIAYGSLFELHPQPDGYVR